MPRLTFSLPHLPLVLVPALLAACGDSSGNASQPTASDTSTVTATAGSTSTTGTSAPTTSTGTTAPPPTTGTPTTGTSTDAITGTTTTGTGTTTTTTTDTTGTTDTTDTTSTTTSTTAEPPCMQGEIICEGDAAKICDGMGGFESEEMCPKACAPGLGCVECVPGESVCNGDTASVCNDDGTGYVDEFCDAVQGVSCQDGQCVGACAPDNLGSSYIGCEYYAVVTPNVVATNFTFAVVVSNVSDADADVTVTRGANTVLQTVVPANTVEVIPLAWVPDLKLSGASKITVDGAYRVRSTQPVTVYQYSPLEYQMGGNFSYTNDASLLMPSNVWGKETIAVARNTLNGNPGVYAVVAREDGTTVTATPSASGGVVNAGGGIAANGTGMAVLTEGDVLLVQSGVGGGEPNAPDAADVTGTRVLSDKPVMVLGAHNCTYIPFNSCCCDHLEEINLPVDNLAKEYIVTTPFVKPPNQAPFIKARMVRVVATTDATTLSYDPPQMGAPTMLAKAGDYAEIRTDKDFKITANFKIAVSEYILSQQEGGNTGDPAMTISVPLGQYRTSYSFHAPINYESNFVNVTAPTDANITLDGAPVANFTPIGATGYGIARVQLSNAGDGDHAMSGDKPFGVQVYGYGQYTSYWYPGGLDLKLIPQ